MKSISITSGKGGVGKSCIAVNLGLELTRAGKRVLLFDADMGLANVDILCGLTAQHTVLDVIEGRKTVEEILLDGPLGMKVLPSTSGILKMERLTTSHLVRLSHGMEQLADQFDLLLVDTGAGLTNNVLFFNSSVDEVLVVTSPEPTSLTDAYALIKVLVTRHDVRSVAAVVNKASQAEGQRVFQRLGNVCNVFLQHELKYLGAAGRDPIVERCIQDRVPAVIGHPTSPFSRDVLALAQRFDEVFTAQPAGLARDMWSRLLQQRAPADEASETE